MIKVEVYQKNRQINKLIVKGHANYDSYGKDIVCAGVSVLTFTIANKLIEISNNEIVEVNNQFIFNITDNNEFVTLLLDTLINGLKSIEEQYPKNIKIVEV